METAQLLHESEGILDESEHLSGRPLFAQKWKSFCCLERKKRSLFVHQRSRFRPIVLLRLDPRVVARTNMPTAVRHKVSSTSTSEELRARRR